jgi:hypothetical protein
MHLRDSKEELLDPDGVEMPTKAVAKAALMSARDCIAADVRHGHVDLRYWIDVQDEKGATVHTLRFVDAVEIAPH